MKTIINKKAFRLASFSLFLFAAFAIVWATMYRRSISWNEQAVAILKEGFMITNADQWRFERISGIHDGMLVRPRTEVAVIATLTPGQHKALRSNVLEFRDSLATRHPQSYTWMSFTNIVWPNIKESPSFATWWKPHLFWHLVTSSQANICYDSRLILRYEQRGPK